jgi:predicted small integral membrane protein
MFISIIKSCINKPVEHFSPVLSLDFEFPVSEAEKGIMKKFPIRFIAYWGILAIEATNIKKDCSEEDFHRQRLARDVSICLARILYFKCTL